MPRKGQSKLTPEQQDDAVSRFRDGESSVQISVSLGVGSGVILELLHRRGVNPKRPISDLPRLAARFLGGETLPVLAGELGISVSRLRYHLTRIGVAALPVGESGRRTAVRIPNLAEIAARYEAGETMETLMPIAGVRCRTALRKQLVASGVTIRSHGNLRQDVDTCELARRYEEGASITALSNIFSLAHNSIRNRLVAQGVAIRPEVETREHDLTFATPAESDLIAELSQWDFPCTPQKAVGRYNLDIAFDGAKLAVEIENGPSFSRPHRVRLIARTRFLLGKGWRVLFVVGQRYITNWGEVMDRLIPLYDLVKSESVAGYGAINLRGRNCDQPRFVLDDLPRIAGY